jgi:hypothetical protein
VKNIRPNCGNNQNLRILLIMFAGATIFGRVVLLSVLSQPLAISISIIIFVFVTSSLYFILAEIMLRAKYKKRK